jgi:WXXGXW repeat (2 copies)
MSGQKEETMRVVLRSLLFAFALLVLSHAAFSQVVISVSFGPPALPVYEQPVCPEDGYIWTPGYWAYDDDDGYYWVPGTWVEAPQPGYLWTPGYWGWDGGVFIFHEGYWGEHVGYYGGINYGYGYGGRGYEGGRWDNGHFFYNRSVNRVNETIIHNTYNTRIVESNTTRVSYNGGTGGIEARPTAQEETYSKERHVGRVAAQNEHIQQARSNPELRASTNQGKPPIAATAKPAEFKSGVVPARQAGGAYKAPPPNNARNGNARPATETRSENRPPANRPATPEPKPNNHASELQPHTYTTPNTGSAATNKKYQQQQEQLAAKQNQEHQKLQQQQEKEHAQTTKKNANDTQKQQMEQRHTQQTQQLEQKHAAQQQKVEQHQPPPKESKPQEKRPEKPN